MIMKRLLKQFFFSIFSYILLFFLAFLSLLCKNVFFATRPSPLLVNADIPTTQGILHSINADIPTTQGVLHSVNAEMPTMQEVLHSVNTDIPPLPDIPMSGDYACILTDDVYFYASPDEKNGLFLLPKTYYVRLIESGKEYCKVEYQRNESDALRITGYARTKDLAFVEYVPLRPYLYHVFDVTYTIESAEPNNSSFLTQITVSCVYYGDYQIGSELYSYVLRGKEFGYIPKPNDLTFEKNNEYNDYLASLTPPTSETPEKKPTPVEYSPMQVVILLIICLLVPILAGLIVKPNRRQVFEIED